MVKIIIPLILIMAIIQSCSLSEQEALHKLQQMHPSSFDYELNENTKKVESISFNKDTSLKEIPEEILAFEHLKTLEIRRTGITEIPEFISYFKHIQELRFSINPIQQVADIFGQFPELEYLSLSHTKITELPPSIFKCKKLKNLLYINTPINGFDERLYLLKDQLEILFISKCEELPSKISTFKNVSDFGVTLGKSFKYIDDLPKLKMLTLDNSTASRFPKDFKTIKKLRNLSLVNCDQITELPASLGYAEVGEYDFVSFNFNGCKKLRGLPESFKNLKNIRTFYLDSCFNFSYIPLGLRIGSLTAIGANWLKMPKNLLNTPCTSLWIDGHRMGTIRGISGMKGLDFAVIINGNILKVPEELCEMKDLHHINLENNKIKNYPAFWKT
ncbi:hypothetical protein AVL50_12280 [Flammeovirga sp. SJP92]|nr:hypothetical protein AVL50_12280 [Flammeovirga sp. SJP92]